MKFYGRIGYGESVESYPGSGVWIDTVTERKALGEVTRNSRQSRENDNTVNNDLTVSNTISVVVDAYARDNFHKIRYVKLEGGAWHVTDVTVEPPRLLLRLGEVYNGPTQS